MKLLILVFLGTFICTQCNLFMGAGNPWIDSTSCPPLDTEKVCSLKKKQCAPVNNIIKPPGKKGLVGLIRTCASLNGVPLNLRFFLRVGVSYAHNNPETIMDNLSSDPTVSANIRACVLNSTGMIGSDGKFNRTAAMDALTRQPLAPNLLVPVFKGLLSCPEPKNYEVGPFLSCLRKACLASATAIFPPVEMGPGAGMMGPGAGMMGPGAGMMGPGAGMMGPGAGMMGPGAGMMGPGAGMMGPGAGMMGPPAGMMGPAGGMMGPGAGMMGPPTGMMAPAAKLLKVAAGMMESGPGASAAPGVGGGASKFGGAPWASFIPSPGAFGGASGFGGGSKAGAGGAGPGAGPGAGGKWF